MKFLALLVSLVFWFPGVANSQTYLLMAEEDGCYWCAKWNKEISQIYPKTEEGKIAPLKRYDLHRDKPDVSFNGSVRFTPTFILVKDGKEVGRIEGYPGEDFFWALLSEIMKKIEKSQDETG